MKKQHPMSGYKSISLNHIQELTKLISPDQFQYTMLLTRTNFLPHLHRLLFPPHRCVGDVSSVYLLLKV